MFAFKRFCITLVRLVIKYVLLIYQFIYLYQMSEWTFYDFLTSKIIYICRLKDYINNLDKKI